ncbi:hypothetical protein EBZ80_27710 [bacterium]|nr:hypothetical protein [bacterium]
MKCATNLFYQNLMRHGHSIKTMIGNHQHQNLKVIIIGMRTHKHGYYSSSLSSIMFGVMLNKQNKHNRRRKNSQSINKRGMPIWVA